MKKFLFFVLAALTFAACEQALVEEQSAICPDVPETITVGFEGDDTRIQLNEAQKTVWTKDDLVSVFYRSDANQKWQYTGETGARTGSLKRVSTTDATTKLPKVVVVYPYNENYYINPVSCNIEATMPAEQTYLKDSYGLDGNIMVSSDEFNQISLKSVYGWLKLQLTGNGEQIKSITVRGNSGEQMAGLVYIDSSDATITLAAEMGSADDPDVGGAGGNLVFEDTVLTEVTLNCLDGSSPTEKGVEVANTAAAFYIALPPQTFTKGITVEITAIDGSAMTKTTDNEVVIERNHIKPMTAFEVELKATKPANNEIWYTNGSTTEPTAPYMLNAFGDATIQSNSYDAEKECWVITFDNEVTTIGKWAFAACDSLTNVTIGDSVTTIGVDAFRSCDLTSVTIPDSVTTIGNGAFFNCTSLKYVYCKPTTPPTGGRDMFYNNASGRKIYVPAGSAHAYKEKEYWSMYADYIFAE